MRTPWFHAMDDTGETPATRALKSGDRRLAQLLLRLSLQHDAQDSTQPSTGDPEDYWGFRPVADHMLNGHATERAREGVDALLHAAAQQGDDKRVAQLLEVGADPNAAQPDGMTALHWVSMTGRADLAEMLIQKGARVNIREGSDARLTPMSIALLMGYDDLVACMQGYGAKL